MADVNKLTFYFTEDSFDADDRVPALESEAEVLREAFEKDRYEALYNLGFQDNPPYLDASGRFLYEVAAAFFNALTNLPELELARENVEVPLDFFTAKRLLLRTPFALGSKYINEEWLKGIFAQLLSVYAHEIKDYKGSVAQYLSDKNDRLKVKERIYFHLVESKNEEFPFAFLATYATKDQDGKIVHLPLQYALTEYRADREKLLAMLSGLNKACDEVPLLAEFAKSGELFHPLRLTAEDAYQILRAVPKIEEAGIICRIPNWWRQRNSAFSLGMRIGAERKTFVGLDSIVSVNPEILLDGEHLTRQEIEDLLARTEGLAYIKGKWVEVNHKRLEALLQQLEEAGDDMTLLDVLRMGFQPGSGEEDDKGPVIIREQWLDELFERLRDPSLIKDNVVPEDFKAQLRAYQETGYSWLDYMSKLGLGALLADDMGLGKTVQVLAYLDKLYQEKPDARALLIVPASLLGNWEKEKDKFAPHLPMHILHGRTSKVLAEELKTNDAFITVTTYGMATRIEALGDTVWDAIILDEAQAIKNPKTKQSRQIRNLQSHARFALTGTPIENDLVNLWAIYDFLNRGLLGTITDFSKFAKDLGTNPEGYARIKELIAPFMLRRSKTDKNIISDLPDKQEEIDYVTVTKKQAVLYQRVVTDLEEKMAELDGMARRGLVLGTLTKLKQICNHPAQYLGVPVTNWKESGKFEMLKDICETVRDNRERVLVFTQFREIIPYLDEFLHEVFGAPGFTIHGGINAKKRTQIVDAFQGDKYYPYIILSVKAGGTGLNLTNANHVIHFDRWWNPAVENQATDRAFRIGQTKNVMVHKLVCTGTIEEKIDQMIESKRDLADQVIGSSSGESWITELPDEELLSMLQLQS